MIGIPSHLCWCCTLQNIPAWKRCSHLTEHSYICKHASAVTEEDWFKLMIAAAQMRGFSIDYTRAATIGPSVWQSTDKTHELWIHARKSINYVRVKARELWGTAMTWSNTGKFRYFSSLVPSTVVGCNTTNLRWALHMYTGHKDAIKSPQKGQAAIE